MVFANFLYEHSDCEPLISAEKFASVYTAQITRRIHFKQRQPYEENLQLVIKPHDHHAHVLSVNIRGSDCEVNKKQSNDTKDALMVPSRTNLEGGIVISLEQYIFFFFKDYKNNSNRMFTPISINESAFEINGRVTSISFFDCAEIDTIEMEGTVFAKESIVEQWADINKDNVLIFKRN